MKPVFRLQGGVGNQLFQLAFAESVVEGRILAIREPFPRSSTVRTQRILSKFFPTLELFILPLPTGISSKLFPKSRNINILSPNGVPDALARRSLVTGYFQRRSIAENLILRHGLRSMHSEEIGVIHVRRSDYMISQNSALGVLGDDYFLDAIGLFPEIETWRIVTEKSEDIIDLTHKILRSGRQVRLDSPDLFNDFDQMTKAKALVISNSTLSLWAGYLSNPNCHVVRPSEMYRALPYDPHLFRPEWLQLQATWV